MSIAFIKLNDQSMLKVGICPMTLNKLLSASITNFVLTKLANRVTIRVIHYAQTKQYPWTVRNQNFAPAAALRAPRVPPPPPPAAALHAASLPIPPPPCSSPADPLRHPALRLRTPSAALCWIVDIHGHSGIQKKSPLLLPFFQSGDGWRGTAGLSILSMARAAPTRPGVLPNPLPTLPPLSPSSKAEPFLLFTVRRPPCRSPRLRCEPHDAAGQVDSASKVSKYSPFFFFLVLKLVAFLLTNMECECVWKVCD